MVQTPPTPDETSVEPMPQDEEATSVTSTSSDTDNPTVDSDNHKNNTNNGYHPKTEFLNQFNHKYDLTETTESTATSLFLNISTKCVTKSNPTELTNGSPTIDTQHTKTQNETVTSTSPTTALTSEPANKRARLSNS